MRKEANPMLFRKKIEKSCTYCTFCAKLNDGTILCAKRGVLNDDTGCMRFRYDPCKRIPLRAKTMDFSKYDQEDYSL